MVCRVQRFTSSEQGLFQTSSWKLAMNCISFARLPSVQMFSKLQSMDLSGCQSLEVSLNKELECVLKLTRYYIRAHEQVVLDSWGLKPC